MEMKQKSSLWEQTNKWGLVLYYWHCRIAKFMIFTEKKNEKETNQNSVLQML